MRSLYICIAVLLVFTGSVCAEGEKKDAEKKYEVAEAVLEADGVQRLEIIADSYFYKPNYIIVKVGTPVELLFKKAPGIAPHDVVVEMAESNVKIKQDLSKEGTIIRFIPATPGKFPFFCSKKPPFLASHRDKGMEGIIEVRP